MKKNIILVDKIGGMIASEKRPYTAIIAIMGDSGIKSHKSRIGRKKTIYADPSGRVYRGIYNGNNNQKNA